MCKRCIRILKHSTRRYTIQWDVTYGTSDDPDVANQTTCDLSRMSYQSWTFKQAVDVKASASDNAPSALTTVTKSLTPSPTGQIFANGAVADVASLGLGSILLTLLGAILPFKREV